MFLTEEQQAILNGSKGETMAKVMESVVRYGELFGAEKLVPVTSKYNHLVTSFGLKALGPVYDLFNKLIEDGAISGQKFSVDPRPCDPNVPKNFLQDFIFNNFIHFPIFCNHCISVYIQNNIDIRIFFHHFRNCSKRIFI